MHIELLDTFSRDAAALEREERLLLLDLVIAAATEREATDKRLFVLPDNDAAFTPQLVIDELLADVERVAAGGPALIRPDAELLATWSGLAHPTIGTTVGPDDVSAFAEYAERLLALPWRAGVKYFCGHDVDGGPGSTTERRGLRIARAGQAQRCNTVTSFPTGNPASPHWVDWRQIVRSER